MKLSIIIPVLNESEGIVDLLKSLQAYRQDHEIIVVDGGSLDATVALASPMADIVLETGPGRAAQMNAGAKSATGELLMFLHGDSHLPNNVLAELERATGAGFSWGRFDVRLSGKSFAYRVIEWFMNGRSRLSGICTGDQAIFVSRKVFVRLGGFADQPLMEDIDLSTRLKSIGDPYTSKERVITSSRRWEKNGIVRTVLLMWYLRLAYYLGTSPEKLVRLYR